MTSDVTFEDVDEVVNKARQGAVAELNQLLGKDASNLSSIVEVVQVFCNTKADLQEKLQLESSAAPDQMSSAVRCAEQHLARTQQLQEETEQIHKDASEQKARVSQLLGSVERELELMLQMDAVRCYQGWVKSVQEISSDMQNMMSGSGNNVELLANYTKLLATLHQVSGRTACTNLERYILDTLTYWHNRLVCLLSADFEETLQLLKYPFVSQNTSVSQPAPDPELIKRLQQLIIHLLSLEHEPHFSVAVSRASSPNSNFPNSHSLVVSPTGKKDIQVVEDSLANVSLSTNETMFSVSSQSPNKSPGKSLDQVPGIVADFSPLLKPLQLLAKPLEVRFMYHFSGSRKTNSVAHPEWCLTKVLAWITAHARFLSEHIQPVLAGQGFEYVSAQTELSRALVRLVVLKLSSDLEDIMDDEDLFCHCIQESLSFERELRLSCGYPASQPSVLLVLTQPQVLSRWVSLERKFAVAVMDEVLSSAEAWHSEGDDCDGWSTCGEQLITLLLAITDRYKALPQPGHRLQFLEVQLELLDEYRVRCVQVARELEAEPVTSHYPSILSTLHTITTTITEWSDTPLFLELSVYREQQRALDAAIEAGFYHAPALDAEQAAVQCGVFDDCVSLYCHVKEEMLDTVLEHVMCLLRARFAPYRRDKWFIEPSKSGSSVRCCDVSGSLCPLLEVLARQLHCLRRVLVVQLFDDLWHRLTHLLDKFFFEELALQNHFSDLGCAQFQHDMTKALFPMFSEFTSKPESHFPMIRESIILMTLPLAPSLLLRDTLRQAVPSRSYRHADDVPVSVVVPTEALADHGVSNITPRDALAILNARNSISTL
ncbi:RINT-1/Tip20 [Trinorchestia longiramus]|nr:RINT-1/Tip20 [Trinorchestia longiramus]